ncbi:uncharacterized protein A4U43_C04F4870 [Asparagus officinalis]|uniref:Uncharacterized protein n=1 Tax=Asparagus officinalis TaxID=4686 RepID=A0A5P1EYE2_ASPOF|nr:uncharacterized protein A4U43_C04F4870 [Asparagus officinalis]
MPLLQPGLLPKAPLLLLLLLLRLGLPATPQHDCPRQAAAASQVQRQQRASSFPSDLTPPSVQRGLESQLTPPLVFAIGRPPALSIFPLLLPRRLPLPLAICLLLLRPCRRQKIRSCGPPPKRRRRVNASYGLLRCR